MKTVFPTEQERELLDYLRLLAKCHEGNAPKPKGWRYHGPADWLLTEGQFYKPGRGPTSWRHREAHACFRNAALYAMEHGLRYVEGYAAGIIPVHHGWCVDARGVVVEVTWPFMGTIYYGVEFQPLDMAPGSALYNWKLYRESFPNRAKSEKNPARNRYERKPKGAQQNAESATDHRRSSRPQ